MSYLRTKLDVLRELRVPSAAMVGAGRRLHEVDDQTLDAEEFVMKWQAAIDVAIAETEEKLSTVRQDFSATPPPAVVGVRGN